MKQFNILFVALICCASSLKAQVAAVDTVLFENFEVDPTLLWQTFPLGDDTIWLNVDVDGLTPDGADEAQKKWYWGPFFSSFFEVDSLTGDTTFIETNCIRSKSWMEGFAVGNRNWLVTPPIDITDDTYVLSFQSAPVQLPRYMDGYSVYVSTSSNDMLEVINPFADRIYQVAQMTDILSVSGATINVDSFLYSPGYIHADSITNWDYIGVYSASEIGGPDTTLLTGYLEPASLSLSQYAGQKIYIAFVHDADDDNVLALDDILVTKDKISSVATPASLDLRFRTFPNPVVNNLNVLYRLKNAATVAVSVSDMNGRIMAQPVSSKKMDAGEYSLNLNLIHLPSGNYTVTLNVDGQPVSSIFTKW